jgi:putative Ca2+/H+ antiporter (TMEM165/GDT1 family)
LHAVFRFVIAQMPCELVTYGLLVCRLCCLGAHSSFTALVVADKNRRRVTFWALTECLLIVAVAGVQVMRIRNFFEVKRGF